MIPAAAQLTPISIVRFPPSSIALMIFRRVRRVSARKSETTSAVASA